MGDLLQSFGDFVLNGIMGIARSLLGVFGFMLPGQNEGMSEVVTRALSYLGDVLWPAFDYVAGFVYGFLPDADNSIISTVTAWTYLFDAPQLDFNIYYFIDIPLVAVFLGIWSAVTVAGLVIMAVRLVLDVVHKVMDSIPIVG